MKPTPEPEKIIDEVLNQFIVFGQKQQPFICARCGAQTDDKDQRFCWCTDRDSSNRADSPTWIDNINYPRFAEAHNKAKARLLALIDEGKRELIEIAIERLKNDEYYTLQAFIEDATEYIERIAQLKGKDNDA